MEFSTQKVAIDKKLLQQEIVFNKSLQNPQLIFLPDPVNKFLNSTPNL